MKLQRHEDDHFTYITPSVNFYCHVKGQDLTAQVIGILDHPLYFIYRIKFSNGFEDDFSILDNGFIEGTKAESKTYAVALKDDMHSLYGFEPDKEIYTMRWMIDGKHINIWVKESGEEGEKRYVVYYNGHYRFELKRNGAGWLARTSQLNEPEKINDKLAVEIGRMIDLERQAA